MNLLLSLDELEILKYIYFKIFYGYEKVACNWNRFNFYDGSRSLPNNGDYVG